MDTKSDIWDDCYQQGWGKNLYPEAYSHPAKVSFKLAERIYAHALENHWIEKDQFILDPFGGICGFGFHAMAHGLNFIAIELEEKFVKLGEQNIELWNRLLKGWPYLGTARIVQGDSRKLKDVIKKADLVVSSPPYAESEGTPSGGRLQKLSGGTLSSSAQKKHGMTADYGTSSGQLSHLKEGSFDMCVSSPPYSEIRQDGGSSRNGYKGINNYSGEPRNYWRTQRNQKNLGNLPEGSFDMCVSSPPYKEGIGHGGTMTEIDKKKALYIANSERYSKNKFNLGNSSGDTFWSASLEIVQQCYELLKPGGHAIWVTKDYVKAKKIVPFSDRWLALCESVGFKLVCQHRAMLVKHHGDQSNIHGGIDHIETRRVSFFRRLAESKGAPKIEWEDVLCFKK